jgi:hypothetical protein
VQFEVVDHAEKPKKGVRFNAIVKFRHPVAEHHVATSQDTRVVVDAS